MWKTSCIVPIPKHGNVGRSVNNFEIIVIWLDKCYDLQSFVCCFYAAFWCSLSLSLSLSLSRITFVSRKMELGVDLMEVVIGSHPCLTRIKGCSKRGSRPSVPLYFSLLISCSSFVLLLTHFVQFVCTSPHSFRAVRLYFSSLISCSSFVLLLTHFVQFVCTSRHSFRAVRLCVLLTVFCSVYFIFPVDRVACI